MAVIRLRTLIQFGIGKCIWRLDGSRGGISMSSLFEKTLVILFSAVLLGLGLAYLLERVIPMIKQIYESVAKLLAAG